MRSVFTLLFFLLASNHSTADILAGELLEHCEKRTKVFKDVNGEIKEVGKDLDGFCRGYLLGHLGAQTDTICLDHNLGPYFVATLLKQYVSENPKAEDQDAGATLEKALLRAYKCD